MNVCNMDKKIYKIFVIPDDLVVHAGLRIHFIISTIELMSFLNSLPPSPPILLSFIHYRIPSPELIITTSKKLPTSCSSPSFKRKDLCCFWTSIYEFECKVLFGKGTKKPILLFNNTERMVRGQRGEEGRGRGWREGSGEREEGRGERMKDRVYFVFAGDL